MTDAVLVALIASVPPTLVGAAVLVTSLRNGKRTVSIEDKIVGLDIKVDGRLTELLSSTKAQGRQDERDEQREDAGK